ncbi:MAG TPA: hypothetical protein DDW55_10445, partial [Gammaproteobacteria bacterium]|nr:hypothetical protein [Gammaproteobacteria bacterium]
IPDDVARDAEGYNYPEGGPNGLYRSIADKQDKLGETVEYVEGVPVVTPGEGNHGHQVALDKQRRNMERKLDKDGIEHGAPEEAEILPVADLAAAGEGPDDTGDVDNPDADTPDPDLTQAVVDDTPPEFVLDEELSRAAHDKDGNQYEEGGPKGLYNAIEGKQAKLNEKVRVMEVIDETTGETVVTKQVTNDESNSGLKKSLARLRENIERKLRKAGLFDDGEGPEIQPVDDVSITETASLETRTRGKSGKQDKVRAADKSQKQERVSSTSKAGRTDRADLFETGVKPVKPARVDKLQKPEKAAKAVRVERPQKPVKASSIGKPQRPERVQKPVKMSKPEKPQKPQKPEKPGRPG